jgi:peptide deformylase
MVTRPAKVRFRAQDRYGEWFELEAEDLTARCVCHELEHLDGHLYVEHIDRFLTDAEVEAYYEGLEDGKQSKEA